MQISKTCHLTIASSNLKKNSDKDAKQIFLHASLAAQVAAWDSYIKGVVLDFYSITSNSIDVRYNSMHSLMKSRLDEARRKFNTPNSENIRNLFIHYCGYDPWPDWVNLKFGPQKLSSSLLVRDRLDEILKVRHSFAHGLSLPNVAWCVDPTGNSKLTVKNIRCVQNFIEKLVEKTDRGIALHVKSVHSLAVVW